MKPFNVNPYTATRTAEYDEGLRAYMLKVYNYMAMALAITGVVAFFTASSPALMSVIFGTPLAWVVMLAPIGIAFFFGFRIHAMSMGTAQALYWTFSVVMGLSMASIFMLYTQTSIAKVFFITAAMFGSVSLWGYTTKKDLSGFGSFLFMGLIGIIIASVVNIFLKSTGLEFIISIAGVLVFTGLTAYDTQRIREGYNMVQGTEMAGKAALMGALNLYMDFINLFIMMLRLFADRR